MLLKILTFPDPILHEISDEITEFDDELRELSENMLETMYNAPGVGLAAIQVGVKKRILVLDVDFKFEENHPYEHQRGDTECGMYVLYFIIEILTGKRGYNFFTSQKITDDEMEKYRKIFFNPSI